MGKDQRAAEGEMLQILNYSAQALSHDVRHLHCDKLEQDGLNKT
jgi:hypothetical protein